jgi:hypothetical protein
VFALIVLEDVKQPKGNFMMFSEAFFLVPDAKRPFLAFHLTLGFPPPKSLFDDDDG